MAYFQLAKFLCLFATTKSLKCVKRLTSQSSYSYLKFFFLTEKANFAFLFAGWSPGVTNGLTVVIAAASVLALVGVIHVTRAMKRGRGYKVVNQP